MLFSYLQGLGRKPRKVLARRRQHLSMNLSLVQKVSSLYWLVFDWLSIYQVLGCLRIRWNSFSKRMFCRKSFLEMNWTPKWSRKSDSSEGAVGSRKCMPIYSISLSSHVPGEWDHGHLARNRISSRTLRYNWGKSCVQCGCDLILNWSKC